MIELELHGLELHGRHGVLDEEREHGQRFLFDVRLGVDDAATSDRIEDAVDYREIAAVVREVSDGRAYALLEALAAAVGDALLARFPIERVSVRVRKPDVRLDPPVAFAAATVERWRQVRAYVGLGANLGERETTMRAALERLAQVDGVRVVRVSSFRETDPVGVVEQPRFLNAAAELETTLAPRKLLDALLSVERSLGRTRDGARFGPRTIDLDLLLYGAETVEEPGLRVPHPRLHERAFALEPLHELDPGLDVPGRGPLETLLRKLESR